MYSMWSQRGAREGLVTLEIEQPYFSQQKTTRRWNPVGWRSERLTLCSYLLAEQSRVALCHMAPGHAAARSHTHQHTHVVTHWLLWSFPQKRFCRLKRVSSSDSGAAATGKKMEIRCLSLGFVSRSESVSSLKTMWEGLNVCMMSSP